MSTHVELSIGELQDLAAFAEELADVAGQAILPYFRKPIDVDNKLGAAGFDPVTEADRRAEQAIRRRIEERFPDHGVLGEEFGATPGRSPLTWVLDPIDGTRAFMCGMAQWGTLIALNDGDRPILGVLDQPYMQERWIGYGGKAHLRTCDGLSPIRTRNCAALKDAILTTTSPSGYFTDSEKAAFFDLAGHARLTRYGGDCYAYGLLALGMIDLTVEAALKPWDIQALIPIVEGAGGRITTWDGKDASQGGRVVAAGDAHLHAAVVDRLRSA
ncbi:MAG: histidinol-phosphatase [Alphaproteobacteria bacterium]|nr:histidinol-phosphatase [Alphaproteobacteria bacterium]